MQNLFELQSLEFEETVQPDNEQRIKRLRAQIPAPVLGHYDRLCASGKKGVARLNHQICGGCHVSVPLGTVLDLKHGEDVRFCDNCGRYLFLEEEPVVASVLPEEPVRRPRRKALAHAH
jgi:predicted  nucleic acid-binding Zn-ribbon protein